MKRIALYYTILALNMANAQEGLRPLGTNPVLIYKDLLSERPVDQTLYTRKSAVSDTIPFLDDFSYSPLSNYPDPSKWSDKSVYVNSGFPIAPPSIGVATFDGLNEHGYPYNPNLVNMNVSGPADELTSVPINLSISGGMPLEPTSNVALSFYYQARGYGDAPEPNDSLILDFFRPKSGLWKKAVWYKTGPINPNLIDTTFQRAFVKIKDTALLHDGFKFRLRNTATTAGNFDLWHVDYIYLDRNRDSIADTLYNDLAFSHIPGPFLIRYSSMPWKHYNSSEMATRVSVRIKNNSKDVKNIIYKHRIIDYAGNQLHEYDGGFENIKPFRPNGYSQVLKHARPEPGYTFAPMSNNMDFRIKHFIYQTDNVADFISGNDSVVQFQQFRDYYAFDDGSSEAGYYVNGTGAKMAYRIKLNYPDTLKAMRIYFDPAGSLTTTKTFSFKIVIWDESAGKPAAVRYENEPDSPEYITTGFKEVPEYRLKQPLALNPGVYYFGIQQIFSTGTVMAVGFDRNYDFHTSLYFDDGEGWKQSEIKGSLMMRPVIGMDFPDPLGIGDKEKLAAGFILFPNPASDIVTVAGIQASFGCTVLNSLGQVVFYERFSGEHNQFSTAGLQDGLYLVVLDTDYGRTFKKLIVHH